jgi:hypothetical protein
MKQAISKIEKDCTAGLNEVKPDRVFGMPTEQDGYLADRALTALTMEWTGCVQYHHAQRPPCVPHFGKLNETIVADWCQALYIVGAHYPGKYIPGPSASMMRYGLEW